MKKKISISQILLIGYSLLMTVLFLKYFYLSERASFDKNFEYEWSYDNTIFSMKRIANGEESFRYYDLNYDGNFERMESIYKRSILLKMTDPNEDGIIDKMMYYSVDGEFGGYQKDLDGDGLMEKAMTILENGDTLKFVDKNFNGLYELEE